MPIWIERRAGIKQLRAERKNVQLAAKTAGMKLASFVVSGPAIATG